MQNLIPRLDCGTLLHMVWNMGYYAFSVSSCLESKSCFRLYPPSRCPQSLFLTVPFVQLFPSDSEIGFYLLLELEFAKPMNLPVFTRTTWFFRIYISWCSLSFDQRVRVLCPITRFPLQSFRYVSLPLSSDLILVLITTLVLTLFGNKLGRVTDSR